MRSTTTVSNWFQALGIAPGASGFAASAVAYARSSSVGGTALTTGPSFSMCFCSDAMWFFSEVKSSESCNTTRRSVFGVGATTAAGAGAGGAGVGGVATAGALDEAAGVAGLAFFSLDSDAASGRLHPSALDPRTTPKTIEWRTGRMVKSRYQGSMTLS